VSMAGKLEVFPGAMELIRARKYLGLQGSLRPELSDHHIPNEPAEIAHRLHYRPIRTPSSVVLGLRRHKP